MSDYEAQYIHFVDDTVIGPFPTDEHILDSSRDGSLIERYVLDQGWDDLAYNIVTADQIPEELQVIPPKIQSVTVNLRLIGIAPGIDPRFALMRLFDATNEAAARGALPTIYLTERES